MNTQPTPGDKKPATTFCPTAPPEMYCDSAMPPLSESVFDIAERLEKKVGELQAELTAKDQTIRELTIENRELRMDNRELRQDNRELKASIKSSEN